MQKRYFLAIDVNDHVKMNVKVTQSHVKESEADVKLVEPENLHFTVKFLGNMTEEQINKIIEVLRPLLKEELSSNVSVRGLGFFGRSNHPKVIWAGVSNGKHYLEELFKRVSKAISETLVKNDEKEAIPHLTLGRVRSDKNIYKLKEIISKECESFYGETLIDAVKLKASTLTPSGSKYSDVAIFPLKKP